MFVFTKSIISPYEKREHCWTPGLWPYYCIHTISWSPSSLSHPWSCADGLWLPSNPDCGTHSLVGSMNRLCLQKKQKPPSSANFRNVFTGHFPGKCWAWEGSNSLQVHWLLTLFPNPIFNLPSSFHGLSRWEEKASRVVFPQTCPLNPGHCGVLLYGPQQIRRGLN